MGTVKPLSDAWRWLNEVRTVEGRRITWIVAVSWTWSISAASSDGRQTLEIALILTIILASLGIIVLGTHAAWKGHRSRAR
jgi:hypothetical protein